MDNRLDEAYQKELIKIFVRDFKNQYMKIETKQDQCRINADEINAICSPDLFRKLCLAAWKMSNQS